MDRQGRLVSHFFCGDQKATVPNLLREMKQSEMICI